MSSSIILNKPMPLNAQQLDCLEKVNELREQIEQGNIDSIAVVACMKKGYAHFVGGNRAPELNLGLDSLKRVILDRLERSGIVRS
jgi:hypothetical protein